MKNIVIVIGVSFVRGVLLHFLMLDWMKVYSDVDDEALVETVQSRAIRCNNEVTWWNKRADSTEHQILVRMQWLSFIVRATSPVYDYVLVRAAFQQGIGTSPIETWELREYHHCTSCLPPV
ncbi:hypothetical protein Tco_1193284 [Tanacetum coccineum]